MNEKLEVIENEDLVKFDERAEVPRETVHPITTLDRSGMIELAIKQGSDLSQLEKLMELQERFEANEARKAYHFAMSRFKASSPEIPKDRKVSFGEGKTSYHHATLANVCEKIIKGLSEHELSHGWKTEQINGDLITVHCVITHSQGHSESTKLSAKPDTSGSKNQIQAIGSTITYLERYTLLALTGLATHDQDNDAQGSVDFIDEKQLSSITDMINSFESFDEPKFCEVIGIDSLEKIPAKDFNKAMKALRAKAKKEKS